MIALLSTEASEEQQLTLYTIENWTMLQFEVINKTYYNTNKADYSTNILDLWITRSKTTLDLTFLTHF